MIKNLFAGDRFVASIPFRPSGKWRVMIVPGGRRLNQGHGSGDGCPTAQRKICLLLAQ
jgi:hypothetical protein